MKYKSMAPSKFKIRAIYGRDIEKYYEDNYLKTSFMHEKNIPYIYNKEIIDSLIEKLSAVYSEHDYEIDSNLSIFTEMKSNLSIESFFSTSTVINNVLNNKKDIEDENYQLVYNLYNSYNYILKLNTITPESIYETLKIMTKDLDFDVSYMYRDVDVFLSNDLICRDTGVRVENISRLIQNMCDNLNESSDVITRACASFMFVYVHPYLDYNGRMSRVIDKFNSHGSYGLSEIILFNKAKYYKVINEVRNSFNEIDITAFVEFYINSIIQMYIYDIVEYDINRYYKNNSIILSNATLSFFKLVYFKLDHPSDYFDKHDYIKMHSEVDIPRSRQAYEKQLAVLVKNNVLVVNPKNRKQFYLNEEIQKIISYYYEMYDL